MVRRGVRMEGRGPFWWRAVESDQLRWREVEVEGSGIWGGGKLRWRGVEVEGPLRWWKYICKKASHRVTKPSQIWQYAVQPVLGRLVSATRLRAVV